MWYASGTTIGNFHIILLCEQLLIGQIMQRKFKLNFDAVNSTSTILILGESQKYYNVCVSCIRKNNPDFFVWIFSLSKIRKESKASASIWATALRISDFSNFAIRKLTGFI